MTAVLLGSLLVGFFGGLASLWWFQWRQRGVLSHESDIRHRQGLEDMRLRLNKRVQKRKKYLENRHREITNRLQKDRRKWKERLGHLQKNCDVVDQHHRELDKSLSQVRHRQKILKKSQQELRQKQDELHEIHLEQQTNIENQLNLSNDQLRQELLENLEKEVVHERQQWMRRYTEEIESSREELAEDYIDLLINRLQLKPTVKPRENRFLVNEKTFAKKVFHLGSPVVKIIEELCQVEFQFDETGHQVTISAFDGVAREQAMRLTQQVIRHKQDDLQWIKARNQQVLSRMEREMTRAAGDLLRRLKIEEVAIEIVRLQGRISYRTSFGQNVLDHQLEVGFLCGMLGRELGNFDLYLARQCGFFHDIGKAIDVVQEGSHPQLGGDFLSQYQAPEIVVHAAYKHHDPFDATHLYTAITTACDAMSASRPGARRESIDSYVEKVESLEKLAREPRGVSSVAVMHAGREIQVNVDSDRISDEVLQEIGQNIAQRIEEELVYPGEIRVHVVRETNIRAIAQ